MGDLHRLKLAPSGEEVAALQEEGWAVRKAPKAGRRGHPFWPGFWVW